MSELDFAKRLARACDDSRIIPPYGKGRQVYIAKRLKVSQEAVRRWFTGDSRPRVLVMTKLAALLEVDEAWLALGIEPDLDRSAKRFFNKQVEGISYVSAGLALLDGAAVAPPSDRDPRKGYVDYYAIYRGTQLAIHNTLGREVSDGVFEFNIPHDFADCKNLGFVHKGGVNLHMLDLRHELIDKHKHAKGSGFI